MNGTAEDQEVKGVPPGLVAEPIAGKTGSVRGVPPGLKAEPISKSITSAPSANKEPASPNVKGVPPGLSGERIMYMNSPQTEGFLERVSPGRRPDLHTERTERFLNTVDPHRAIYQDTVNQGYSSDQARRRQREYDYAIGNGMTPERAQQFAMGLDVGTLPKKALTDQEKIDVAARVGQMTQDERVKSFVFGNPREFAEGYAEGRARGMSESDAIVYGSSNDAQKAMMRTGQWLSPKWTNAKAWMLRRLGAKDSDHVTPEQAAEAPMVATGFGQTPQDYSFNIYKDASWVDKHLGKPLGSLQAHLDNLVAGFTTPDQAVIEAASFGTEGLASGTISALGIEAKVPISIQRAVRTTQQLAHAGFTTQMAVGTGESLAQAHSQWKEGNVSEAIGYTLDGLVNGVMAGSGLAGAQAHERIKTDLNLETSRTFEGKKFGDLTDQQQAVVIDNLIHNDPFYKKASEASEKDLIRNTKRLNYRYNAALREAWHPDAVKRMLRVVEDSRTAQAQEDARLHYLRQLTGLLSDDVEERQSAQTEWDKQEEERRTAEREGRPIRKSEEAQRKQEARRVQLANADQVSAAREMIQAERNTAQERATERARRQEEVTPERHPDRTVLDGGFVAYRATTFGGEDHFYGVAQTADGNYGVFRQTADGTEFLQKDGTFSPAPEQPYEIPNRQTADVLSQISALRVNEDVALENEGATPEREKEAVFLRDIETQLVDGALTGEEARLRARLPGEDKRAEVSEGQRDIEAAQAGMLYGPLHERTRAEAEDAFATEVIDTAGWTDAEKEAALDQFPLMMRMQTEHALSHVGRSGDYIISKKGTRWTLDSKGVLHPDDDSAPIPLMKNGIYTGQAIQLAQSGRIGFGMESREQRRIREARERNADRQLQELSTAVSDQLERAIFLAKQNEGLLTLTAEPEAADVERRKRPGITPAPELDMFSPEREYERARADILSEQAANRKADEEAWVNAMGDYIADHNATAWSLVEQIAKNSGMTPQEVLEHLNARFENDQTPEGKAAKLEPGDTISAKLRQPWVVEQRGRGLYLRSGDSALIPINRFRPSSDVLRIIKNGEITKAPGPKFGPEDIKNLVYKSWFATRQLESVDEVNARAEGKVQDPEPRTERQAEALAAAAEQRADDTKMVATTSLATALDPPAGTELEDAKTNAERAETAIKTAETAAKQHIAAADKVVPTTPFPERAPVTMGPGSIGLATTVKHLGEERPAHYVLIPIDAAVPSHLWNGTTAEHNPAYDQDLQPATISEAEAGEMVLDSQVRASGGRGYDFDLFADKTIGPLTGPIIIEKGGRIVAGNRRFLRMLMHLNQIERIEDPEIRDAYRGAFTARMKDLADSTGIATFPGDGKQYVVARQLDDPIQTRREAAHLGMLFNTNPSVEIREAAKGVALAKMLGDSTMEDIGRMLDQHDTLGEAIANNPQVFTDIVKNELGISQAEEAGWFHDTQKGKVLSDQGRRRFVQVLMGKAINDTSVLEALQNTPAYTSLERSIINLARLNATKHAYLVPKIVEALQAAKQTENARVEGEGRVDRWEATYAPKAMSFAGMEEDVPPMPDKVVEAVWRAIYGGPRTLSDRLKAINATDRPSIGMSLWEQPEVDDAPKLEKPAELFNRVFRKEIAQVERFRGAKGGEGITEAEFDASLRNRAMSDEEVKDAQIQAKGGDKRRPETQALRRRIDQLSGSEKDRMLLTSRVTGLPNLTDFEEHNDPKLGGTPAPFIGFSDMTGLKAFNDTYGHDAGDKLLKAAAGALREAGLEAYHVSGDEFIYRAANEEELKAKLDRARDILKNTPIEVEKDGQKKTFKGADFTYGIGKDLKSAEGEQHKNKAEAQKTGERGARGEMGNIKQVGPNFGPPPEPKRSPDAQLAAAKESKGYVTPQELLTFLKDEPSSGERANEIFQTAKMMAEYVYDLDPPPDVDRKESLAWALQERVSGLEHGKLEGKRGSYTAESEFGRGVIALHKASDPTTFIHEWAHALFPLLSETDMKAIETIPGPKGGPKWDGSRGTLKGDVYKSVSEKFSHGLERFIRDENPTGFSAEVKQVLKKIKAAFIETYRRFLKDPLAAFSLTEDARQVFADMLNITDFDAADDFRRETEDARKAESKKGITSPDKHVHPIVETAKKMGADGIRSSFSGKVIEQTGERVDPTKPTVTYTFKDLTNGATAWMDVGSAGSKIQNAELIEGLDGTYGIRFNVDKPVPKNVLYQDAPKLAPGLELEDLERKLKATPANALMVRRLLELRIDRLKSDIRSRYGMETPKPEVYPELAKAAIEEVKRATPKLREVSDDAAGLRKSKGITGVPQPPVMGMPRHAGAARAANREGRGAVSLADVKPVDLQPIQKTRGKPVGILPGERFDEKAWREGLKRSGLPENIPAPTATLSPETARVLKYAGQKQSAQTILSALEQGDGAVLASATGSGKSFVQLAVAKEVIKDNPDARILVITKNRGLLKDLGKVATDHFGLDVERDAPEGALEKNIYGASYQRLLNNPIYRESNWDLVIADESGEARNWYLEENQQGKLLMAVMDKAKKGVYVSATPFHSPMEYGYLEKLNLWKKGEFESWIRDNFAHEKVGDKIIARLDPGKQAKLREQLIERGQFVSQEISYDGFSAHFGVVPVSDEIRRKLDRIHQGIAVAKRELLKQGKKGLAERIAAFEATYTKAFLERSRLPEAIQLVKRARAQGWQVAVFSETTSEDLFRRPLGPNDEPGTYRKLDEESGGLISRIMPEFPNVVDELRKEFSSELGDYSGLENTDAQREAAKRQFLSGERPILYTSYAAGGIGVSLHDTDGDKPRVSIFLGPPYSGVLLEQAMGRNWRFGVKSDARAVFLATDSEPDIRLMATKIGPRMRAVRASVLGERDSLAAIMQNYSDEEKMREQQDILAFDQGNEMKVDAQGFTVRSKRKVAFDNWSAITFPKAAEAMHRGMKIETVGGEAGGDWTALYQDRPRLWEAPQPPKFGERRAKREVNQVADSIATGRAPGVQKLDPADRTDIAAGTAAVGQTASEVPVDRDAAAAGRMAASAAYHHSWELGPDGVWRYKGDFTKLERGTAADAPPFPPDVKTDFKLPGFFSGEVMVRDIARQAGNPQAGIDLVVANRKYTETMDGVYADFVNRLSDIQIETGLKFSDKDVMRQIWGVVEGKRASDDPKINKAAQGIVSLHKDIRERMAAEGVKLKTPSGEMLSYADIDADPNYMPHRIDWNAKLEDPLTKEQYTLREIMGKTFGDQKRERMIRSIASASNMTPEAVIDYLNNMRTTPPVMGHIHRARTINFPIYRQDLDTELNYINQVAHSIATEKVFGSDLRKLNELIDKVPSANGRATIRGMFDTLFRPQDWNTAYGRLYNAMAGYEALSKMTWSALKVPFHLGNAPLALHGDLRPMAKAVWDSIVNRKEFKENTALAGTIIHQMNPMLLVGDAPEHGLVRQIFKKTQFERAYRWSRAIAGASARVYMEQYAMKDLMAGADRAESARRILKERLLIGDHAINEAIARGNFTEEELRTGQRAFANFTVFSDNPLQMPAWARLDTEKGSGSYGDIAKSNLFRAVRMTYLLQSFAVKVHSLVKEAVYDEVVHHKNYKPLLYLMIAEPVLGTMLRGIGAAIPSGVHRGIEDVTGQQHQEDSWDKFLEKFKALHGDHPLAAALQIYVDGFAGQTAFDLLRMVADPLIDMSSANLQKARSEFDYLKGDVIEQQLGPAWTTLFLHLIDAATGEMKAEIGNDPADARLRNFMRWLTEEFPAVRTIPGAAELTKKKKASGGITMM